MLQDVESFAKILKKIQTKAQKNLCSKYNWTLDDSLKKISSDMMFMRKSHDTAKFRDLLFSIDSTEFLHKIYKKKEGIIRLSLLLLFHQENCKVYPNYCKLEEAKYIYEGLFKKQRLINQNNIKHCTNNSESSFFDSSIINEIENESWNLVRPLEEQLNALSLAPSLEHELSSHIDKWKIYNKKFDDSLYMLEMLILKIENHDKNVNTNKELNEEEVMSNIINQLQINQKKRKERLSVLLKEDESFFDEIIANNSKNISYDSFYYLKKENTKSSHNKPKIDFSVAASIKHKANTSIKFENKKLRQSIHLYKKSRQLDHNPIDTSLDKKNLEKEEKFLPTIQKFVPTEKFVDGAKNMCSIEFNEYREQIQKVADEMKNRFSINAKFKILRFPVDSTMPEGTFTKSGSELYKNSLKMKKNNKFLKISKNTKKYNPQEVFSSKLKKKVETIESCMGNVLTRNFQSASLVESLDTFKAKKTNFVKTSTVNNFTDRKLVKNKIEYKTEKLTLSDLKVTSKRKVKGNLL